MLNYDNYSTMWMCFVIIPKIGATLSTLCSIFVAQGILKLTERRAKMTNRVILVISISDIIFSTTCNFFVTWPVPQGLVYGYSENQGTCTAQGLLIIFSVTCGAFYNTTLALTYLLQVRYEWSEEKLRRYDIFFILVPIFVGLVISTSQIPYSAYNFTGGWACVVAASPLGWYAKDSGFECIRGANARKLQLFFTAIPLLMGNIVMVICMILIYRTALIQERNIDRFNISGDQNHALSKRVATQGIYLSGAYFLTFIFWFVYMVIHNHFDAQPE